MIKKESLYIAVIIAFVIGFLSGVVFSAFHSTADMPEGQVPVVSKDGHDHTTEQDAISALLKTTQAEPENYQAWVSLGHNYFDTHQHKKAIEAYDKALSINNSDANVWTDMGVMYRKDEQPEKAIECFTEAISRDPNHLIAHFNTGLVSLIDLHNPDAAVVAWEKAVALNPNATAPDGKSLQIWLEELKKSLEK